MTVLLVLGGVLTLIAGAAFVGFRWWNRTFLSDLDLSEAFESLEHTWTPEAFPNTGSLPMSTRIGGTFVRWHNPAYYARGAEFWKTFQDGPWKWDEQQRYAGKGDNCGHYFALTEAGARAEGGFYSIDYRISRLLSVELACDAILDLTYEQNLLEVAKLAISNWQTISERHFFVTILSFLIDPRRGGCPFTDFIGHWASRSGYNGVLFFGARALEMQPTLKWYIEHGADDGMMGPIVHGYFYDMRKHDDLKNLAIFSGARLTTSIATARLLPDPPDVNPYHGVPETKIDALVEFKADYQAERASEGFYLATPFEVS